MSNIRQIRRRLWNFMGEHSLFWRDPGNWYVGVTSRVDLRRRQHEKRLGRPIRVHKAYKARTARAAARIEADLLAKGMQGGSGGWTAESRYVYVFKVRGPMS